MKKKIDYHSECYLKGDGGAALSLATAYFQGMVFVRIF